MTVEYIHERDESKWKTYKGPPPEMPAYAPHLVKQAREYLLYRELNTLVAVRNGWYPVDMDCARIVIPCTNSEGSVYWQARRIDNDPHLRYASPTAPRGDSVVVVYPIHDSKRQAIIVEGPMDALVSADFGYLGIALMGNNPAEEALDFIVKKFGRTHVPFVSVPDNDDLEFGAKLMGAFAIRGIANQLQLLSGGKDLCELTMDQRKNFFNRVRKSKK